MECDGGFLTECPNEPTHEERVALLNAYGAAITVQLCEEHRFVGV